MCLLVTFVVLLVILDQIVLCWGKNQNLRIDLRLGTNVPKFVPVFHFCGVHGHIRPNCHKLKSKHSVFQSTICDDISPAISPNKLFHMLLKNLSLLACERNLQDFSLSQKIGVIPQIHSTSHEFSPTKPKTRAIWVRKDSLRWVLLTCPWFNSFNCLWTCFVFVFIFYFLKNPKTLKNFKETKIFYFVSSFIFSWGLLELWYLSWFRTCLTLWRNLNSMCYKC